MKLAGENGNKSIKRQNRTANISNTRGTPNFTKVALSCTGIHPSHDPQSIKISAFAQSITGLQQIPLLLGASTSSHWEHLDTIPHL